MNDNLFILTDAGSELLAKVVPLVNGCNDTIAKITIAESARTFARESDIILETQEFEDSSAPEEKTLPENALDSENFLPLHFVDYKKDTQNRKVFVTYSLLPKTKQFPKCIIDRHYEAIVSHALFTLFNMPGRPWTNGELASFYLQKYRIALGDAIRDNTTGGAVFDQKIRIGEEMW